MTETKRTVIIVLECCTDIGFEQLRAVERWRELLAGLGVRQVAVMVQQPPE